NQEVANQLNLSDAAYRMTIQKNLILSYGDELGLDITQRDIAQELVNNPSFQSGGKFDKQTYVRILTQNRTTPVQYEEGLKRNLLLQKIEALFQIEPTQTEVKNLNKLLFLEDNVDIKILDLKDIQVSNTEVDRKKFWEENKNRYMSMNSYELQMEKISVVTETPSDEEITKYFNRNKNDFKNDNGKLKNIDESKIEIIRALNVKKTKKIALKTYLKVKKGEKNITSSSIVFEDKLGFSPENREKVRTALKGSLIKPFLEGDNYVLIRVINQFNPKPLTYDAAKYAVSKDFDLESKRKQLEELAKKELEDFSGVKLGYISRDSFDKVTGLNANESAQFLNALFAVTQKKGQINIDNKIVLYTINDSRFSKYDSTKDNIVKSTLSNLQNSELMSSFVERLESRYEVQSTLNTKEQ
ncbi:MAG: SurA N-terminal domain-containing protein, partial [Campylobacteraceae bacterium]|nr:SurA N-terminal domain-containing protein [Campylobacteraceae bacterium]